MMSSLQYCSKYPCAYLIWSTWIALSKVLLKIVVTWPFISDATSNDALHRIKIMMRLVLLNQVNHTVKNTGFGKMNAFLILSPLVVGWFVRFYWWDPLSTNTQPSSQMLVHLLAAWETVKRLNFVEMRTCCFLTFKAVNHSLVWNFDSGVFLESWSSGLCR